MPLYRRVIHNCPEADLWGITSGLPVIQEQSQRVDNADHINICFGETIHGTYVVMEEARHLRSMFGPLVIVCVVLASATARGQVSGDTEWPNYGNDPGGMRYSPLSQINRENVSKLQVAWIFHTGDVSDGLCRTISKSLAAQDHQNPQRRLPLNFSLSGACQSLWPCSAVSRLPRRAPSFFTPWTRRIPAARSALSRPQSAAS
jgi:hypothetical protein